MASKKEQQLEIQSKTLDALQALTKGIQKSNTATEKSEKTLKKLAGAGAITNSLLKKSQSLLSTVLNSQDQINKTFLGFGRSMDVYTTAQKAAGTHLAEELQAHASVFRAGIRQNTDGVTDMNRKLIILGKNTTVWNKLIAVQTQVMRQDATNTFQMYTAMMEQAQHAGLDVDRLARVLDGVSDTMMKLRAVIGTPGIAMQGLLLKISDDYGHEIADLAKVVLGQITDPTSNNAWMMLGGGRGGVRSTAQLEDLLMTVLRGAENKRSGLGGSDFIKSMIGPAYLGAFGITTEAAVLAQTMLKGPMPKAPGTGMGMDEARNLALNDPMRQLGNLFLEMQKALTPVVQSLGNLAKSRVFPHLHNVVGAVSYQLRGLVSWIDEKLGRDPAEMITRDQDGNPISLKTGQRAKSYTDIDPGAGGIGTGAHLALTAKGPFGAAKYLKGRGAKELASILAHSRNSLALGNPKMWEGAIKTAGKDRLKFTQTKSGRALSKALGLDAAKDISTKRLGHIIKDFGAGSMLKHIGTDSVLKRFTAAGFKAGGKGSFGALMGRIFSKKLMANVALPVQLGLLGWDVYEIAKFVGTLGSINTSQSFDNPFERMMYEDPTTGVGNQLREAGWDLDNFRDSKEGQAYLNEIEKMYKYSHQEIMQLIRWNWNQQVPGVPVRGRGTTGYIDYGPNPMDSGHFGGGARSAF